MTGIIPYLIGAGLVVTLGMLALGLIGMVRGGAINAKYGNRLMRLRVVMQGLTVLLLILFWLSVRG